MQPVLLIDFGSTYTKVTAVDISNESILGTARAFTTVETDISEGLQNAEAALKDKIGQVEFETRLACSSAAGGLKMVAVGLVPDLTAEAAKRAALSAGAKVLKVYSYEVNEDEAQEINKLMPDIILLTGGTDGGNKHVILHNAKVISEIEGRFPVVVAGNKSVARQAAEIIERSGKQTRICENVMPEFNVLNIEPARTAIREIFLQRIIQAKGLTKVQSLIQGLLMPTPSAVLNAAHKLSTGVGNEKGIGDLMVIDVGGATTDVHSIAGGEPTRSGVVMKGLPEPFAKRTVEGDLGVRYSALALTEAVGIKELEKYSGLSDHTIMNHVEKITRYPETLSNENVEAALVDDSLAALAVKHAVERHVGNIETVYTPFGVTYLQTGKDVTGLAKVIGTGGPIINSNNPTGILKQSLFDETNPVMLKPQKADLILDKSYILAAMGLLCEHYPETAVRILKRELRLVGSGE
ncbi:methylaspartate mutase accessory protein GlmL [Petroclostridium sp. X23]|uniref:methylaspartate mutase accessory protein GlmL n=1 Tax=Petroclostridium sp. X23 TaxID=3045146 RepID=UPI0024AE6452|nr:methylaspartate mutase accessory protein GlmL [Petroclostridium sp. X23]WHH61293.1 methylaspartate mutase accessory protein GlmL [Petroclostridium sp. X23]